MFCTLVYLSLPYLLVHGVIIFFDLTGSHANKDCHCILVYVIIIDQYQYYNTRLVRTVSICDTQDTEVMKIDSTRHFRKGLNSHKSISRAVGKCSKMSLNALLTMSEQILYSCIVMIKSCLKERKGSLLHY